jgi:hypothetical protein
MKFEFTSKQLSYQCWNYADLESSALLRSVAFVRVVKPGLLRPGCSHSLLDLFSCVSLYQKQNPRVNIQMQDNLNLTHERVSHGLAQRGHDI